MKKLITLALALMMVLPLAACGGKTDPAPSGSDTTPPPQETQSSQETSPANEEPANVPAGPLTLDTFGLTAEDIMPSEATNTTDDTADSTETVKYTFTMPEGKADDSAYTLSEQLFNFTKAIADDGIIYAINTSDPTTLDIIRKNSEEYNIGYQWNYQYKGIWVGVYIESFDMFDEIQVALAIDLYH